MPERTRSRLPGAAGGVLLAAALLLAAAGAARADGPVRNQSVTAPRAFGYTIGDQVQLRIAFELARGYRLDHDALPETGRVTRWLALNDVHVQRAAGWQWVPHVVTLTFQVVNASRGVIGVGTPPRSLRVVGPEDDFPVIVPAFGFTIAPVTQRSERPQGSLPELRPALPPPPVETTAIVLRAGLAAAGCLLLVASLAYRHGWIPLRARRRDPFTVACRRIGRIARREVPGDAYPAALGEVHRAFNATAGHVVFEHGLERFFREHAHFEPLREPITGMFQASTARFFGDGGEPVGRDRVRLLLELCRACRDRERGLA